jgi:hypothetical protein
LQLPTTHKLIKNAALLFCFIVIYLHGHSQRNIQVNSIDEFTLRDQQLLYGWNPAYSFTTRPLFVADSDSILKKIVGLSQQPKWKIGGFHFYANPFDIEQQGNTHSTWGRNNGSFLSVKGYQQKLSTGFTMTSKFIDLQFLPEWFYAKQTPFTQNGYSKFSLGQSAIRLHLGNMPIGVSLSNENIWWGPGIFNSLMMSNNAPGFEHFSIHTRRPMKTWIGAFEFQVIGGTLKSDPNLPMENFNLNRYDQVFGPMPSNNDRYFSGLNLAYQPSFLKGLTVGLNRMFQYYISDRAASENFTQRYFPVFTAVFKNSAGGLKEDARDRDQLINVFGRFVFPNNALEVYGEYGWNDHKYNLRDLTLNPDGAAAYIVGLRKVVQLEKQKHLTIEAELTQLEPTNSDIGRPSGNWYVHGQVNEGYTNQNQILGGGIGPGDNTATLRVSLSHPNLARQSITIERYQHDPRFHQTRWTDFTIGLMHQQKVFKNWFVNAHLDVVRRNGYEWGSKSPMNIQWGLKTIYYW